MLRWCDESNVGEPTVPEPTLHETERASAKASADPGAHTDGDDEWPTAGWKRSGLISILTHLRRTIWSEERTQQRSGRAESGTAKLTSSA
jgi:hypothetical protein